MVDANVLIEEALRRVTRPDARPTALAHLMAIHAIRLFGKADLLDEVAEHLPRLASRKGLDPGAATAVIDAEYAPRIRLVDVRDILLPDAEGRLQQVAAKDPDDEPTARLARLLDPSILLTRDRALLDLGCGVWVDDPDQDQLVAITGDEWLKASLTVRDRAFLAQMEAGGRAMSISGALAADAARKMTNAARRHPIPAALLLGGLLALLWVNRSAPIWQDVRRGIGASGSALATEVAARAQGQPAIGQRAQGVINEYLETHAGPDVREARIARAITLAEPSGLTAIDLYDILGRPYAVLPVLRAHAAFVRDETGAWHLGIEPGLRDERDP